MDQTAPLIRNISDTARWVAIYRAQESERPDALFRDPLARRLAGERGEQIAAQMPFGGRDSWPFVLRTYLVDQFILERLQKGTDMVINLGAGLCARPYRMALPSSLQWIEVDLPEILDYKEQVLAGEKPVCKLERIRLDLANVSARRELFSQVGNRAASALLITEGVIAYLTAEEVGALARDLAAPGSFRSWILDLVSPGLLRIIREKMPQLVQAGLPLKFGPAEGQDFFRPFGWKPAQVHSMLKFAARARRVPLWMRLLALFPDSSGAKGSRPWSGVCLLEKS